LPGVQVNPLILTSDGELMAMPDACVVGSATSVYRLATGSSLVR
jgi:hypothetical protein